MQNQSHWTLQVSSQNKDPQSKTRKFRFVALLLPMAGFLLILPPLVSMRGDASAFIFGVPVNVAYLFGVWMSLIVGAYLLQRNIPDWPIPKTKTPKQNGANSD